MKHLGTAGASKCQKRPVMLIYYLLRYLDERLGWHDVDWLPTYFTYLATAWMVVCGMEV